LGGGGVRKARKSNKTNEGREVLQPRKGHFAIGVGLPGDRRGMIEDRVSKN